MRIEWAAEADYTYIAQRDHHLPERLILPKIRAKEIYILRNLQGDGIGWLRYGYFWDNTPFMNLLWIDEPYRGQGVGREATLFWEREMAELGHRLVMTSTLSNEEVQHFYRKLGYQDAGGLLLPGEPLEIVLIKSLDAAEKNT